MSFNKLFLLLLIFILCSSIFIVFYNKDNKNKPTNILYSSNSVWVFDENNTRCLAFDNPSNTGIRQTCISLKDPLIPVFQYYKMVLGSLFVQPEPQKILIIGLGGGVLAKEFQYLTPARIEIVEINPDVIKVAKQYFDFKKNYKTKIYLENGLDYVQRIQNKKYYDLIILDAFVETVEYKYIPKELLTLDFINNLKNILAKDGVIVANTFSDSMYANLETNLFKTVFGKFYNLDSGNRIMIAKNGQLPNINEIRITAQKWREQFDKLGINTNWLLDKFLLMGY